MRHHLLRRTGDDLDGSITDAQIGNQRTVFVLSVTKKQLSRHGLVSRKRGQLIQPLLFYAMFSTLFPLGISPGLSRRGVAPVVPVGTSLE
jgi:hypothetical protein